MLDDLRRWFVGRLVTNSSQINRADGFAMFIVTMDQRIGIFETKPAGKQRQRGGLGWHRVRLLIMHQLNVVFDGAQQSVAIGENADAPDQPVSVTGANVDRAR